MDRTALCVSPTVHLSATVTGSPNTTLCANTEPQSMSTAAAAIPAFCSTRPLVFASGAHVVRQLLIDPVVVATSRKVTKARTGPTAATH